jgi:hypothetical protein
VTIENDFESAQPGSFEAYLDGPDFPEVPPEEES